MQIHKIAKELPVISIALAVTVIVLYFAADDESPLFTHLALDKTNATQIWRYVTGHFLHVGSNHLVWNLAATAILCSMLERNYRVLLSVAWFFGLVGVNLWFLGQGTFDFYVGLSGVLNSVFVAVIYSQTRWRGNFLRNNFLILIIFCGYVAKNIYESITGAAIVSDTVLKATPGAHLAGMLGGFLACGFNWLLSGRKA